MDELLKLLDKSLNYLSHDIIDDIIVIHAESTKESAECPYCGELSQRVHSKYLRTINDLPIQDKKCKIILHNKKYMCVNPKCDRKTFAESFQFFEPKATKSNRLQDEIFQVSLLQSSIGAAKYLSKSVTNVGKSTICNLLKKNSRALRDN